MFEMIFSAVLGFYMGIVSALFGGAGDAPMATTTETGAETSETASPETPATPPAPSGAKAYTQGAYYSQTAYTPKSGPNDKLFISKTQGAAPLAVTFSGIVSSTGYSIEYGDGKRSGTTNCRHLTCPATPLTTEVKGSHTYETPGIYTAKLRRHYRVGEADCAGSQCNVVATVTVTIFDPSKVCRGYKDGETYDFQEGETTTTIPGGHFQTTGHFECVKGEWQPRE